MIKEESDEIPHYARITTLQPIKIKLKFCIDFTDFRAHKNVKFLLK
ncbi:hypothetical protein SA2149_06300 [Aggregatibacter actinomycetemcomitans serotype e str. SA2149]|nr:hypothetical protein SA2149_06300 [Aggregatibacter actinomycetemcomitans serotype e str. SA2149]KYK77684.1 hypothetical protein SA2876_05110 [Aggregatibacter actinomycetemcomitans serotype e str. SA2876]KYK77991.1 hypothetical protein SC936_09630 [Aggregatibacter actinomycetemcomitans serotype e str. SC936]KYK80948.1 hypothetical protein SC383S_02970 [Aggregatibacter actinomycetemcomitans SC383s]